MSREEFNRNWSYRRKVTPFQELGGSHVAAWTPVTLPHDALIEADRHPDVPGGHTNGYFPGGAFEYRKTFPVPEDERGTLAYLEFDGVYRDAVVTVNGALAGRHPYGYSRFVVRIDPFLRFGAENEVTVACRSHLDSRWYTGCGIYRDVHLIRKNPVHLAVDGVRVTTPDVDDEFALVEVSAQVDNAGTVAAAITVEATLTGEAGAELTRATTPMTVLPGGNDTARLRMLIQRPRRWSAETPHRYTARVAVSGGGRGWDEVEIPFGIRTVQVDPRRGLRINGTPVKLRGACLHADNGPLGAAAIGRAEERKIELLKAAGFNAVRSSHHPAGSALLDACDRLGMYVIDEAFDMWIQGKSDFDYSADFPQWWERDLAAMVAKDFHHPSVLAYSIGNENPETGTPDGGRWTRRMVRVLRDLDPTRPVTNGINGFVSALDAVLDGMRQQRTASTESAPTDAPTGAGVNGMMHQFSELMGQITASPAVTERTQESFAALDIAGMNYGESRYELDDKLFPDRVVLGTETWPTVIDRNWALVQRLPHVIGDFTWTGLDYLGETGIGLIRYADTATGGTGFSPGYPGLTANCGDLDLTGHRRPVSYYREIVFGQRKDPWIAVQPPRNHARTIAVATPWAWSDTVASWSWPGHEGDPVHVEVYADGDEVELLLDGEVLARNPIGTERAFRADFEVAYRPGELTAVTYRNGESTGRTALASAGEAQQLTLTIDRHVLRADTTDLAFIGIAVTDDAGVVHTGAEHEIRVAVHGAGVLQGLGSAAPVTDENFGTGHRRTFDGQALAIVRPTAPGKITVTVEADACAPVTAIIGVAPIS
ncbi:glycoside hydrolase family 2 protein [Nocardia carnea]|uniref:glycoside hydrolase family 2 protein n=1 Tax=Nocardia carnea TaxID=37328 RepID=UPI00245393E5|nr:glycoside hydrolase family 2 TIM barrel-domain containing protein [Nocardia carnea]